MNEYYKSGIDKTWNCDFVLDEDGLRKLFAIIEIEARELNREDIELGLFIHRKDDRFYETMKIEEVLKDSNHESRKINRILIFLRETTYREISYLKSQNFIVYLEFNSQYNNCFTRLVIDYENLNWGLIIADKIEPLIERTFVKKTIKNWHVLFFIAVLAFFIFQIFAIVPDFIKLENYDKEYFLELIIRGLLIGLILYLVYLIYLLNPSNRRSHLITNFIGPKSYFAWGDEYLAYKKFSKYLENIKWGIIVSLFLSIFANIFTGFAFKKDANKSDQEDYYKKYLEQIISSQEERIIELNEYIDSLEYKPKKNSSEQ